MGIRAITGMAQRAHKKWLLGTSKRRAAKMGLKMYNKIAPIIDELAKVMEDEPDKTAEMMATVICVQVIAGFEEFVSQDAVIDMATNTVKDMQMQPEP